MPSHICVVLTQPKGIPFGANLHLCIENGCLRTTVCVLSPHSQRFFECEMERKGCFFPIFSLLSENTGLLRNMRGRSAVSTWKKGGNVCESTSSTENLHVQPETGDLLPFA